MIGGRPRRRRGALRLVVAIAVLATAACRGSSALKTGLAASGPSTTTDQQGCPQRTLVKLTEAERVGQLFMIGEPLTSSDQATRQAIKGLAVGGVVFYGDSNAPVAAIRALTDRLQAVVAGATPSIGLFISTNQEGGQVQELAGPGFDAMPSAVVQGMTDPTSLEDDARRWGSELSQAGVNVDLAPVLDVVPPSFTAVNQPIARYQRELGNNPATVASHGVALVRGFQAAGVSATLKHFPGLGRVVGNTDTTSGVEDTLTTRHDAFLAPFASGVRAGARLVMISLATYSQIDPNNFAAFSSIVIRQMLRGDLGFRGLVISDDLGSAKQVLDVAPATRAVDFLAAGGTIVLVVRPVSDYAVMVAAVLAQAAANPTFRKLVDADALEVLTAKQAAGLLACPRAETA